MRTKKQYIEKHNKNNMLRQSLEETNWPDDTPIIVIGGLIAPHNKNSNLYNALKQSKLQEYCIGGHRKNGTEGWWIAVA